MVTVACDTMRTDNGCRCNNEAIASIDGSNYCLLCIKVLARDIKQGLLKFELWDNIVPVDSRDREMILNILKGNAFGAKTKE